MMKPSRPVVLALQAMLGCAPVLVAASAHAQPAESIAAQSLFEQGRQAMARGEFAKACARLEESQRLAPAAGTAFNLADCYVHIGRWASAWSLFRDVEAQASLAEQVARGRLAGKRADELEAMLPRLLIQVDEKNKNIAVQRDGVSIGWGQWGTAIPVDLGEHVVTATAPNDKGWRAVVLVTRAGEIVTVTVPPLERAAAPTDAPTATATATAPATTRRADAPLVDTQRSGARATTGSTPSRVLPAAFGLGGLGLLAASGVTIAIAHGRYSDAGPCDASGCHTQQAVDQRNSARGWGDVATGLAVVGGLGVATGVILWLAQPARDASATTATAALSAPARWDVALGTQGVSVRGSW